MTSSAIFPQRRRSTRVKTLSLKAKEAEESKMAPPTETSANTSKKRKATGAAATVAKKSKPSTSSTAAAAVKKAPAAKPKAATTKTASKTTAKAAPKASKAAPKTTSKTAPKAAPQPAAKADSKTPEESEATMKRKHDSPQLESRKKLSVKKGAIINEAPTKRLKVFVFGEGSAGELGLGAESKAMDVKRPRLNKNLSPEEVGVVQVAVGGMHCVVLTHDNRILTWGVNDQGTLGRETKQAEVLRDIGDKNKDGSDSDSEAGGDVLNPLESTPGEASFDNVAENVTFTSVSASDSCTFAVTDDGRVYGCGTFRNNEGILGFDQNTLIQTTLKLIPDLKNIKKVVCGVNHAIALDKNGNVFAWGAGQQNQLGRRVVERTRLNGLIPREFGLPRRQIIDIFAGAFHSFAIDKKGEVWTWGLNSYGETGCADDLGEDEAVVLKPTKVRSLQGKDIVKLRGGAHHSLAITKGGEVLGFGRIDGFQLGMDGGDLPEDGIVKDEKGKPRICSLPTPIPGLPHDVVTASCGPDHCLVVTEKGRCWSWGFSVNYQTGQGTEDDVEEATMIDNTATREERLVYCGAGGQFGVLASEA